MAAGSLHPVSRSVTFAPGLLAAVGGWAYLGQPAQLAGLGVMALAGLVLWPAVAVSLTVLGPAEEGYLRRRPVPLRRLPRPAGPAGVGPHLPVDRRRADNAVERHDAMFCL